MIVLNILTALLMAYLAWAVLYQMLPSVAGHFFKTEKGKTDGKQRRFAVLMPAYREDRVIVDSVKAALQQNYPKHLYEIVPIADQMRSNTLEQIRELGVEPLVVNFTKSTKSKSLNAAINAIGSGFDAVVVLDADNHPEPNFLQHMNETLGKGFQAVQGRRIAKNSNNAMAVLDGVSEAVNNHILCSGQRALGLSARLAGSAMAFDFQLFKRVMKDINALGGFDKELELKLTMLRVKISYAPAATVFDEKVDNTHTFSRQRGRWLAAQYRYGQRFAGAAIRALVLNGNADFFNKTIQMALPPRLLLPIMLMAGVLVSALFSLDVAIIWQLLLAGSCLSFALAIPQAYWGKEFFYSLFELPKAAASTFKALMLIPLASKSFLHTPHHKSTNA